MEFLLLKSGRIDFRAWLAFLLGALVCVLALSYAELQKEPSGLLVFDVTSTQPGILKVIYTKDGLLIDPGWAVNFSQGNTSQAASFPLRPGQYELIGFKPLVEAGGKVSIRDLKIISGTGIRNIGEGNFAALNQLDKISTQNGEIVIAPAQDATDPFGAFPSLREPVPQTPIMLETLLWVAAGKLALIAIFLILMYGLSSNLPFARGESNQPKSEPCLSQGLGFLAVGLIILYLRNSHSIFFPALYAEDGAWSADIINHGFFYTLFNARTDYFVFGNVLLLAYLSYRAPKLGYLCEELPTVRRYPKGEVPTKISAFKGNLSVLQVLFKACFGRFDPRNVK